MSIPTDDIADTGPSDLDAIAALTATLTPPKAGSKPADEDEEDEDDDADDQAHVEDEDPDDDDDADGDDDDDQDDDEDDQGDEDETPSPADKTPKAPEPPADDAVLKVLVNGVETEVTVGSLKRLAGQEASLTRKSQEADLVGSRAATALNAAIESVVEDLLPYKDLDWVLEGRRMDPEEFEWHRETFTRLQGRYNKLMGSVSEVDQTLGQRKQSVNREAAEACLTELTDPKTGIEGWNEDLYSELLKFGVTSGLASEDVESITSAPVLKIIHKAMLYDKGKAAASQKLNTAPAKVRRTAGREAVNPDSRAPVRKQKSGPLTDADAQSALLGRWGVKSR